MKLQEDSCKLHSWHTSTFPIATTASFGQTASTDSIACRSRYGWQKFSVYGDSSCPCFHGHCPLHVLRDSYRDGDPSCHSYFPSLCFFVGGSVGNCKSHGQQCDSSDTRNPRPGIRVVYGDYEMAGSTLPLES